MSVYPDDFLKAIPKTDLHLHLDGSLRLPTLIDLARSKGVELPAWTEEGLRRTVFKDSYGSLDEYLKGFSLTGSVMDDAASVDRIAYELAQDSFAEGVRYIEVRLAPQLHIRENFSFEEVMAAVDSGLARATAEWNSRLADGEPEYDYGIIVCAMRFCNEHFSPWYRSFFAMHRYSDPDEVIKLASLELVRAAVAFRDSGGARIVGFDIAGSERGYPASNHREAYEYAHRNFLHKTVHAGEAYGAESIFTAITKCHADRIGHGLLLFSEADIADPDITDRSTYVKNLANYIADRRITVEVCLTSNMQTNPRFADIKKHSLALMLEHGLSVTFCTDNRLVSNTTVCKELRLALDNFAISPDRFKDIVIYGFKRSFRSGSYADKRKYVRSCIDWYEKVARDFGVGE